MMDLKDLLPDPPSYSEDDLRRCRETGDYRPILFEWYKFVGSLNAIVAHVKRESPAFRPVPRQHYHVLAGLLNRCARLMLSNVALSHEGRFGETTAIIDRCIFESSVKILWLCTNPRPQKFTRYLADSLRTELELRALIERNINARGGEILSIEERMLESIANHIRASELKEIDITSAKNLPDLASMIEQLGHAHLLYFVGQKLGSHHVHGTWSSLLMHYLEEEQEEDGQLLSFAPRGHDCDTHINQFAFVPLMVLAAMAAYADYALEQPEADAFADLFGSTEREIRRIYTEATGNDE